MAKAFRAVLSLLNVIATVLPANAAIDGFFLSFLILCFQVYAFLTNAVSSEELRSAIERRCRGANGENEGVLGEE